MNTASNRAVPTTYIDNWIKLDFFNNSNLKTDIQNRISPNIESLFLNALNDIRGDNSNGDGISFSEITRLAMAYFFGEIFKDKISNNYYTLEMVKGFLDADNLTTYSAIYEIDVKFYKLNNAPLFRHCWLVIQSAWFFNSKHFGQHQYIDYINHYITTSFKLPIEQYNFDRNYLEKKYADLDKSKFKATVNGNSLVRQWYFYILFLICKELQLPVVHFAVSDKDCRQYNPLTKTPRQLRPLAPFKIVECDIKSAFPTFLDIEVKSNLKDFVYNNLILRKGISRGEAKILFNTICNSGKYKSKEFTKQFFIDCGYTVDQSEDLLYFTHNEKSNFISFMTEQEQNAINNFVVSNNLQRSGRLHDSVLFIDYKTKPVILFIKPNCEFGYKEINRPLIKESFSISNKRLPYAFISSLPKGLKLIAKYETNKPDCIGESNPFRFYKSKYQYVSANFNLNNYNDFTEEIDEVFHVDINHYQMNKKQLINNPYQLFISLCEKMLDTLFFLNKRILKPIELELILKHIRRQSFYVFNVKATYLRLCRHQYQKLDSGCIKERDYDLIENVDFKKNIDFIKAMNEARKNVNSHNNYKDLIDLMLERIQNEDYAFLNENKVVGHRNNNKLIFAVVRMFNLLCTGSYYKPRVTKVCKPFIGHNIKRLQTFEFSESNKQQIHQLYLILCKVAGAVTEIEVQENKIIQHQLKLELIKFVTKITINDLDAGVNCFEYLYKPAPTNEVPFNMDLDNSFETDLSKSIFNNISESEASSKGEVFFNDFLNFHKYKIVKEDKIKKVTTNNRQLPPEINFNC